MFYYCSPIFGFIDPYQFRQVFLVTYIANFYRWTVTRIHQSTYPTATKRLRVKRSRTKYWKPSREQWNAAGRSGFKSNQDPGNKPPKIIVAALILFIASIFILIEILSNV